MEEARLPGGSVTRSSAASCSGRRRRWRSAGVGPGPNTCIRLHHRRRLLKEMASVAIHLCTAPAPAPPRREISTSSLRNGRPDGCGIPRPAGGSNAAITASTPRPHVDGKFFGLGTERLWLRGVTYGTFAPDEQGLDSGLRSRSAPTSLRWPRSRNECRPDVHGPTAVATRRGCSQRALGGGRPRRGSNTSRSSTSGAGRRRSRHRVREQAAECAGHPAVLCFAVGNEIPDAARPLARQAPRRGIHRTTVRRSTRGGTRRRS